MNNTELLAIEMWRKGVPTDIIANVLKCNPVEVCSVIMGIRRKLRRLQKRHKKRLV